jgi:hypothetical protein
VELTPVWGWFYNTTSFRTPPPSLVKLRMARGGPEIFISVDLIWFGESMRGVGGWVELRIGFSLVFIFYFLFFNIILILMFYYMFVYVLFCFFYIFYYCFITLFYFNCYIFYFVF